jgi:hypothetical protein
MQVQPHFAGYRGVQAEKLSWGTLVFSIDSSTPDRGSIVALYIAGGSPVGLDSACPGGVCGCDEFSADT